MKIGKTTEQFIEEAKLIHGDKYDYSKVNYISAKTNVIIKCYIHGEFKQQPTNHLQGKGCGMCSKNVRKSSELFIKESKFVHGEKYDYSLVKYKHSHSKVILICHSHGEFECAPTNHLRGKGCPKCGDLRMGKAHALNPTGWSPEKWRHQALKSKNFDSFKVYIIMCWNDEELFFKIGRTFVKTEIRFRSVLMPYNYSVIEEYVFGTAKEAFDKENELKRINKNNKYLPKIHFNGKQECFKYLCKYGEDTVKQDI